MRRLAALVLATLALAANAAAPLTVRIVDWMASVPPGWTVQFPSNEMRVAQFAIEPPGGPADCVVFFFGASNGGPVDANIARWASQFTAADGGPASPAVTKGTAAGLPVTWVAIDGRYARGVGTGPQGAPVPGQALRVAILETSRGNLIFQLWGAGAAVARQEPAFRRLVETLKPAP